MKPVRDLLKHSSIYAIGQILTRMASVMLLPLYTNKLSPADYGVTAILDLTSSILALLIGSGMATAVTRSHFDDDSESHRDRVWWTGLAFVSVAALCVLGPLWLGRQWLSDLTLGHSQIDGAWFYSLTLMTTWAYVIGNVCDTYLRVQKWSGTFVLISLLRLLLNIGLNVWFLVGLEMGIRGLLLGNLIASVLYTVALLSVFVRTRGRVTIDMRVAKQMFRFSAPLVVTGLLCMLMHESDRYVVRMYGSMEQVGVYSLAHKIGFAVHTLCLMPFISIWHVAIYDIERQPNAKNLFSRIFTGFVSGLGVLLLGASLIVHPVLPLLTPDAYGDAIELVSVILLGFFFFGLQIQFEVPALLSKRTQLMVPGSVLGVIVNIAGNLLLVPVMGVWGAAWIGVATYAVSSLTIYAMCRNVYRIEYPWTRSLLTIAGLVATYLSVRFGVFPKTGFWGQVAVSIAVCAVWASALVGKDLLEWWQSRQESSVDVIEHSKVPGPSRDLTRV
ncbi:MAG: lipopolysaccharide biosynthesis protein [Planctomycetaceae bacterium]|nr:lipopolysaccharide biosynthesis protein [Planctomycetaceae bacterium]